MPRDPVTDHHRATVAALCRSRHPDDPDLIEARRTLRTERTAAYIQKVLAEAPPFTDEQRTRLAELLAPPRRRHAGDFRAPAPPGDAVQSASGGSASAENLIKAAHAALDNAGISMSPSKVTRLVREFKSRVEANGYSFWDFLGNAVLMNAEQRRRALADPDVARVICYADPTGETAVNNALFGGGA